MNRKVKRAGQCAVSAVLAFSLMIGNSNFSEAKKVSKQESVYVNVGTDGSVSQVTVSDWLKGSGAAGGTLRDESDLKEIKNVKGDETFTQQGTSVEWATSGKDIYYQGKTEKELPVRMKVTYELDGKKMDGKALIGKSGKLKIHVNYENTSSRKKVVNGKQTTIYTPFVMVTGMILSSDVFSNIEIDKGRVINDGSNNIVVGLGVPGMTESLDLDEDVSEKIPEGFTVTAEVKDFSMGNTFTYASPNLLNALDLDKMEALDELEDKLEELTDAAGELIDGSGKLADNMELFAEKMGELKSSVAKFKKDGVDKLAEGIGTLAKGAPELAKGVKEYTSGVTQFAEGTTAYVNGTQKVTDGCTTLYDKVKDLPGQMNEFSKGLKQYTDGVDKVGTKENIARLKAGTQAVSDGISTLNQNLTALEGTYDTAEQLIQGLKLSGADATMIAQLEAVLNGQKDAVQKLRAGTSSESELKQGAVAVSGNVALIMDGLGQLSGNSTQLTKATETLASGMPELVSGVRTLKEGGQTLARNNAKLKASSKKLVKASKKLSGSVTKVNRGVKKLDKGGKSLKKASGKLVTGVDALAAASNKLEDGGNKLAEGMSKFNSRGIKKITDTYNDKVKKMLNRMKAIHDAGEEYKSFSGTSKGMDGEVKFIFETDSMEKEN